MAEKQGFYYYTKEEIDEMNTYSTEERAVGKWINGSTLYKKTVDCGSLPNATYKDVAHNISNLNQVVKIDGIAMTTAGRVFPLPFTDSSASENCIRVTIESSGVISLVASVNRSAWHAYITLYYTKVEEGND